MSQHSEMIFYGQMIKKTLWELWETVDNLEIVTAPKNLAVKMIRSELKNSNVIDLMERNQEIPHKLHKMEHDDTNEFLQDKNTYILHDKEENTMKDIINDVICCRKDDATLVTPSKKNINSNEQMTLETDHED